MLRWTERYGLADVRLLLLLLALVVCSASFHMVLLSLPRALAGVVVMKEVQSGMTSFCFLPDGNGSDLGKPKLNNFSIPGRFCGRYRTACSRA